ncbi:hypothetical protein ACFLTP_08550 [Chloroflexota bacterium]
MRRGIGIAMVGFGLNVVITGIWNLFPPFNTILYVPHVINSCIFGLLAITHIWLNRKTIVRYFKGLRRWWILVGLGVLLIIWVSVIMPVLYIVDVF